MVSPPPQDQKIGIMVYSTDSPGTGGRIRVMPGDFVVDELISPRDRARIRDAGNYAVYGLSKRGIDTGHALSDIYKKHRLRLKALGMKDAAAHTTQYVCATATGRGRDRIASSRYDLERLGYVERPLTKKAMTGNRFRIVVRDYAGDLDIYPDSILNHYGYQRFGSRRPITHLVGKAVILGDMDEALRLILYETSPYDTPENTALRQKMSESPYRECLDMLPRGMDTERTVMRSLLEQGEARKAFLAIPLYIRRLYVQAYQSYLFNLALGGAMQNGITPDLQDGDICFDKNDRITKWYGDAGPRLAVPLVGYSYYKKTRFHPFISDVLKREGVSPRMFYIKDMQEISAEGGFRQAMIVCSEFTADQDRVEFTLSRGSYATMVIREIVKPRDPVGAGF